MKWNPVSRRHLLQGMGATLTLPFLPSLLGSEKEAKAAGAGAKNLICIGARHGVFNMYGPTSQLMPKTPETTQAGVKVLANCQRYAVPGCHTIHHELLATLAGANGGKISQLIDSAYGSLLSKMTMLQGLDYIGMNGHNFAQFGNWHTGKDTINTTPPMASLDVIVSDSYKKRGLPSDIVAYRPSKDDLGANLSFRADGTPTTNQFTNPLTLWTKYFDGASIPTDSKLLLVDRVLGQYTALKNGNRRLGAEDRQRLQAHIDFLHATETRLKAPGGVCAAPAKPGTMPATTPTEKAALLKAMNDVIVSLIACDMCHLFTGWAQRAITEDANLVHDWAHEGFDGTTDTIKGNNQYDNLIAHNDFALRNLCLDLATKLAAMGQLDNSLIVYIQEHNKKGHETWNIPAILFGSAGGTFKTGQYIDYRNIAKRDDTGKSRFGFPMNQLYANILDSMGVTAADFEPLNKTVNTTYNFFKANSGYGIPMVCPQQPQTADHYATWTQGYDMSSKLPLARV